MGLLLWPFHSCLLFHEVSYLLEIIMAFISKVTVETLSPFLEMCYPTDPGNLDLQQ